MDPSSAELASASAPASAPASPHLGVSSWSLHRALGSPHFDGLRLTTTHQPAPGALDLLDLPAQLQRRGFSHLELCHFHILSGDPSYLHALREQMDQHDVSLWALLLDEGDIAHPTESAKWIEWNKSWIDIAAQLGARHARVIAGQQPPTPENLSRSKQALQVLAGHAAARNVRLLIENWFDLLPGADEVLWMLDELKGAAGLKLDFNNWKAPHKYAELPRIAGRAESAHAKCVFDAPGQPDEADFTRCLEMLRSTGFSGQYTLIYDGADADEWAHLDIERAIVKRYL